MALCLSVPNDSLSVDLGCRRNRGDAIKMYRNSNGAHGWGASVAQNGDIGITPPVARMGIGFARPAINLGDWRLYFQFALLYALWAGGGGAT